MDEFAQDMHFNMHEKGTKSPYRRIDHSFLPVTAPGLLRFSSVVLSSFPVGETFPSTRTFPTTGRPLLGLRLVSSNMNYQTYSKLRIDRRWPSPPPLFYVVTIQDSATGNVSLTLKPSVVLDGKGGEGGGLTWSSESLKRGLKVKGTVASVKDYGVFIQIHDSQVRHDVCAAAAAAVLPL